MITLHHGSEFIIEHPSPSGGRIANDYGQGFYCTEHIELAREWAVDINRDGIVNTFELDESDLNILDLNSPDFSILHWLTVILEHREFKISNPVSKDGFTYLTSHYHIDLSMYDVIKGYRADDSYFAFARAFLSNSISISQLEQAMYLGELGQQYFIKSQKGFDNLKFKEATVADHKFYYPLKKTRDDKARRDYKDISATLDTNGTYMIDLIRKSGSN